MAEFDSIFLDGQSLRPAPFVSTSYEYFKTNNYIIGGFLIVNLNGTLVGEDVVAQCVALSQLQNKDCLTLKIGCSGGSQFLDGVGRIRNIDISQGDQPFVASYNITVAIETIGNEFVVKPDSSFLSQNCLDAKEAEFLLEYSENISVQGEGGILSSNGTFGGVYISKSYMKANGTISVGAYARAVCGKPDYNGIQNCLDIIQKKAAQLIGLEMCDSNHPLSQFNGWQKWLDTKNLSIDDAQGKVTWSFDVYMTQNGQPGTPFAWVDITTEDKKDMIKQSKNNTANGTIKGLSSSTNAFLGNKACSNERLGNAYKAFNLIQQLLIHGTWDKDTTDISGQVEISNGSCSITSPCCPALIRPVCYQRVSSSTNVNPSSGEITFSAEFADISQCLDSTGIGAIDVTVDRTYPVYNMVEHIVPNKGRAIVQVICDTPEKATITIKGTLNGCDISKMPELRTCVDKAYNEKKKDFNGWIITKNITTNGTYSYGKTTDFIKCN
jgi:hypothetical protein